MYLTQLIYINPGKEAMFQAFEDIALRLLSKYRGELLLRMRPTADSIIDAAIEIPYEIHVVRFASEDDFKRFSEDGERKRALPLKTESVRDSILIWQWGGDAMGTALEQEIRNDSTHSNPAATDFWKQQSSRWSAAAALALTRGDARPRGSPAAIWRQPRPPLRSS
jgi:hypothetical protein